LDGRQASILFRFQRICFTWFNNRACRKRRQYGRGELSEIAFLQSAFHQINDTVLVGLSQECLCFPGGPLPLKRQTANHVKNGRCNLFRTELKQRFLRVALHRWKRQRQEHRSQIPDVTGFERDLYRMSWQGESIVRVFDWPRKICRRTTSAD
jgi:hypothetical protein